MGWLDLGMGLERLYLVTTDQFVHYKLVVEGHKRPESLQRSVGYRHGARR